MGRQFRESYKESWALQSLTQSVTFEDLVRAPRKMRGYLWRLWNQQHSHGELAPKMLRAMRSKVRDTFHA